MNNPAVVITSALGNFLVIRRTERRNLNAYKVFGHYAERQKAVRHRRYLNRFLRNGMKTGRTKSGRN